MHQDVPILAAGGDRLSSRRRGDQYGQGEAGGENDREGSVGAGAALAASGGGADQDRDKVFPPGERHHAADSGNGLPDRGGGLAVVFAAVARLPRDPVLFRLSTPSPPPSAARARLRTLRRAALALRVAALGPALTSRPDARLARLVPGAAQRAAPACLGTRPAGAISPGASVKLPEHAGAANVANRTRVTGRSSHLARTSNFAFCGASPA